MAVYSQQPLLHAHSFPTRRSSDLQQEVRDVEVAVDDGPGERHVEHTLLAWRAPLARVFLDPLDRKSTRLNSSHRCNSYAVFCLKQKSFPPSWKPFSIRAKARARAR